MAGGWGRRRRRRRWRRRRRRKGRRRRRRSKNVTYVVEGKEQRSVGCKCVKSREGLWVGVCG